MTVAYFNIVAIMLIILIQAMQELINRKRYEDTVTYQIIGGEKQILQIILMPGQSIVTKRDAILYTSENISTYNTIKSLFQRCM